MIPPCLSGGGRRAMLDGNSRHPITFCQTWPEPEVHRIMDLTVDKNMIDKDEYPQTAGSWEALRAYSGRSVELARCS